MADIPQEKLLAVIEAAQALIQKYEEEVHYQIDESPWAHDDGGQEWKEDMKQIEAWYELWLDTLNGRWTDQPCDLQFNAQVYDYNRHGIAAFNVTGTPDERRRIVQPLIDLANSYAKVIVRVWRVHDGGL